MFFHGSAIAEEWHINDLSEPKCSAEKQIIALEVIE